MICIAAIHVTSNARPTLSIGTVRVALSRLWYRPQAMLAATIPTGMLM